MYKIGIPESEIKHAMQTGCVDLLTVIPVDDLDRGVAFVRTMIAHNIVKQASEDGSKTMMHFRISAGISFGMNILSCELFYVRRRCSNITHEPRTR